ncbi:MAG TPA: cell division protein SepF [Acidimicrobiales bacterium]|jgi:cell division inhibitor SepF|nr:cell division protein SepF [Acidimicrobiales bacterium]
MASIWRRTMVYLGLVDDEEYDEYEPYEESPPPAPVATPRPTARRAAMAEPAFEPEREREPSSVGVRTLPREPDSGVTIQRPAVVRPITASQHPKVHVVAPAGFNDAQEIGDKLKANQPVIVNLQGVNRDLSRRLIDFASGLTYGLGGQMERVAEQVFLLTPSNVEVPAEEKRRLQERGLYRS